jgi:hypothetical protein
MLAAGKTFVVAYVSEDTTGKNITPGEVQAYLLAGVGVLLVYEYSTTAAEGGQARGARDAAIAVAGARALGYPLGAAIAFAIDENMTGRASMIAGYCAGFTNTVHAAGYRSMVYGGLATVQYALDHQLVDLAWQTYAWSGSPTVWDPRAVLRQYQNRVVIDGKYLDLDVALVDDFGAWSPIQGASMQPNQASELDNAYAALLTGGDSCGPAVPDPQKDSRHGNSVIDLLQHNRAILDKLDTPLGVPVVLSPDDRTAIITGLQTGLLDQIRDIVRTEVRDELAALGRGITAAETEQG